MQMDELAQILATFCRVLAANPGRLVPFLAYVCAITLVIAVVSDAMLRRRQGKAKSPHEKRDATLR